MRMGSLIAATLLGVTVVATSDVMAQSAPGSAEARSERDARSATVRAMSRAITIELNDSRLEDVIQFLRDFSGAEIEVFWVDDQATDGLQKDQRITISAKNMTVLDFIERLLEKAQTDFSKSAWQFSRDGRSIEIGPKSRLNERAYLKMYDINDLIFQVADFTDAPRLDLDQVLNQGQQGSSGSTGGIFEGGDEENPGTAPTAQELADKLVAIITENIEPEQWQDNGGSGGTIRFFNGFLMIRAPDYIQRQLTGYPAPRAVSAQPTPPKAGARSNASPSSTAAKGRPSRSGSKAPPAHK